MGLDHPHLADKRGGIDEFPLPKDTQWEGLKLKAEIEVKGTRYPVHWSCRQKTNPDGSLTLSRNVRG